MTDKIEFLKRFSKTARIILADEIEDKELALLSSLWIKIFKQDNGETRKKMLLDIWKQQVGKELSNTIAYLEQHLKSIDLIRSEEHPEIIFSVLYSIENDSGEIMYYEGRHPLVKANEGELKKNWDKIPLSIRKFYENVHDGFYFYASMAMGLVPIKYVAFLGDDDFEWGIIEKINEPLKINLNASFGFFANGMGTYVAIDYTNCEDENATWWSAKEQPWYDVKFWSIVDEWIVIGLEEE